MIDFSLCEDAYAADFSPKKSSIGESLSVARNDKMLKGKTRFVVGDRFFFMQSCFCCRFLANKIFTGGSLSIARNDNVQTGLGSCMWMTRFKAWQTFFQCAELLMSQISRQQNFRQEEVDRWLEMTKFTRGEGSARNVKWGILLQVELAD